MPEELSAPKEDKVGCSQNIEETVTNGRSRLLSLLTLPAKFVGETIWGMGRGFNNVTLPSGNRTVIQILKERIAARLNGKA